MSAYAKPEGFQGRKKGSGTYKKYKWSVIMFKDGNWSSGKFSTVAEMNKIMGLGLSGDQVYRLTTGSRVDEKKRNGKNSFLARYGHIKIEKIDEPRGV